ncbi:hypothetical protein MAH1_13470 [Sessilibacter sp. MAH1]
MNLLLILGILFIALFILIPVLERYGKSYSPEEVSKISRWAMPLVALLIIVQILLYFFW